MKNPVQMMLDRASMIRPDFVEEYGFGKNLVLRLSQGRVRSVTPRIESALWDVWAKRDISADEFDEVYNTLSIDNAYQRWCHNRRIANGVRIPLIVVDDPEITPFMRVVKAIGSVSKTASLLAVPDVVVQRYADGRQKEMPAVIRDALATMGYKHLAKLESAQDRYHAQR